VSTSQNSKQGLYWWENEEKLEVNETIVEGLQPYALGGETTDPSPGERA